MITPIGTLNINQICERKNDLLVSTDDVKALARNERNKAIDDFVERLKGKAEEMLKNPDIVAECKKCTIWTVRNIDEIAEEMRGAE